MEIYDRSKIQWFCCHSVAGYASVLLCTKIQSQRITSLILHKEKYNPEDLQCLYQEKRNYVCNVKEKKKRMTGGRFKTVVTLQLYS